MAGLVIDASVVLAVMLPDEADKRAEAGMETAAQHRALVPLHWPLEVVNGLLMAERRRWITDRIRQTLLGTLVAFPFDLDEETNDRVWRDTAQLAIQHKLTIYDAAYLELAMRAELPLSTLDDGLRRAAQRMKVPLLD